MARKKLSVRGRVVAAGASVAVAAGLGGFMAARDHTADAGEPSSSSSPTASDGFGAADSSAGANATTFPDDDRGFGGDTGQATPQPQTRTGGS